MICQAGVLFLGHPVEGRSIKRANYWVFLT